MSAATLVKCFLGFFILAGITVSLYACSELFKTWSYASRNTERIEGIFLGYEDREVVSRSTSTNQDGDISFQDTTSYVSYPCFEIALKDGTKKQITESKHHLVSRFSAGESVGVIVAPQGYRMDGFYSLYFLDLCILFLGLCFTFAPLFIGKGLVPLLSSPAGVEAAYRFTHELTRLFSLKIIGPLTAKGLLQWTAIGSAVVTIIALGSGLNGYFEQMRIGFGYGLIKALESENFDEARVLIQKRKGINSVTEHGEAPLHIALKKGRFDLVRMLIDAGADVNASSKMIVRTPLAMAADTGDLETVKLLLLKGASPDA
ncbi:MAG TPA: ankyrin repeat domain-containing protein, partial [Syntrophorhabdaceae bacterium]|nr:ankyrin repeat domain-containing protein [Syntrophorhabdaceae bacterium]